MLAKAFAKCIASLDNPEEDAAPMRQAAFIADTSSPRVPLAELKAGIPVIKLSWRGLRAQF
jgi:hypothetical protein